MKKNKEIKNRVHTPLFLLLAGAQLQHRGEWLCKAIPLQAELLLAHRGRFCRVFIVQQSRRRGWVVVCSCFPL